MKRLPALAAEGLGSLLLAATVVGSGIMAERLSSGNVAIALLANTGATVAVLATLIALLGPLSGAHFNPAVSLVQALRGRLAWPDAGAYIVFQIAGCCAGVGLAHEMFGLPWLQTATHVRAGWSQELAEAVATFGLILVVLGHRRAENALTCRLSSDLNTFGDGRILTGPGKSDHCECDSATPMSPTSAQIPGVSDPRESGEVDAHYNPIARHQSSSSRPRLIRTSAHSGIPRGTFH